MRVSITHDRLGALLSAELLALIDEYVAERVATATLGNRSPWLTRAEAADYLRFPLSRLEKDRRIPCHRDGGRILYHRGELDEYVLALDRDG